MLIQPKTTHDFFVKPQELTPDDQNIKKIDSTTFIAQEIKKIEDALYSKNIFIEYASTKDIFEIIELIKYETSTFVLRQISESDLYRIIRYGVFPILKNQNNKIVGFNATEIYHGKTNKAVTTFVLIEKQHQNNNLGVLLSRFTSLECMKRGAHQKETWVHPNNYSSLKKHLNKEGFIVSEVHSDLFLANQPRLIITLPLTPKGLNCNRIDNKKLEIFLNTNNEYTLLECDDIDTLNYIYNKTELRIVALLSEKNDDKNLFLAIPISQFDHFSSI